MTSHVRRQIQRAREYAEYREADEQAQAATRKKARMKARRTQVGDRVTRFPSADALLSGIEELREALTDLYDDAAAMHAREGEITERAKPDASRFDVLKEG